MSVIIETSMGDITVDLYVDERQKCCLNFLKLCKVKYYNWCLFHSVQQNLVCQTGDPTGTGRGGESVWYKLYGEQAKYFDAEVKPRIKHRKRGLLSMVNNGSLQHGSQFFITAGENLDSLDGIHTVFGEVSEGFDVLEKINESFCDQDNRPYQNIRIFHTVILEDPFDDPPGLTEYIPDHSPMPHTDENDSTRIGVNEKIDVTSGMTKEEVEEMIQATEAKSNAQVLAMIGDLPDADVKPPDNVLFVCKLNPVTTDEDLEIIFSRFGEILSCEIIRDHKSGESLQYAFIEFEKEEDCENAYFKMDNVLIDERRIHVDFSQSVSKLQWKERVKNKNFKKGIEEDDEKEKYIIKDQMRRDTGYDLVFEDPSDDHSHKKMKYRRHKNKDGEKRPESKSCSDEVSKKIAKSRNFLKVVTSRSFDPIYSGRSNVAKPSSHRSRSRSRSPHKSYHISNKAKHTSKFVTDDRYKSHRQDHEKFSDEKAYRKFHQQEHSRTAISNDLKSYESRKNGKRK